MTEDRNDYRKICFRAVCGVMEKNGQRPGMGDKMLLRHIEQQLGDVSCSAELTSAFIIILAEYGYVFLAQVKTDRDTFTAELNRVKRSVPDGMYRKFVQRMWKNDGD